VRKRNHSIHEVFKRDSKSGDYALSIISLGVTHTKDVNRSLGFKKRLMGNYQLTEIAIPCGVVAWQYYVYKGDTGISRSQYKPLTPTTAFSPPEVPDSNFTPFDQFHLEDGDQVIWRQVAILRDPNGPPPQENVFAATKG
jgi:hypothetical protein